MKSNRFFSVLSLLLAVPAAAAALYMGMTADSRPAKLLWSEPGARAAASALVETLSTGDFQKGSDFLYGTTQLILPEGEGQDASALLWNHYCENLTGGLVGEPYLSPRGYCQDAVFYVPDLDTLTRRMKELAPELVTRRIVEARELSDVYDADYSFRQDLISEVLVEAARSAIAQEPERKVCQVQLRLVYEKDRWLIQPDQALLDILAGKMENQGA